LIFVRIEAGLSRRDAWQGVYKFLQLTSFEKHVPANPPTRHDTALQQSP
jgi:hypothetical protein